jgi:hypothetical protein
LFTTRFWQNEAKFINKIKGHLAPRVSPREWLTCRSRVEGTTRCGADIDDLLQRFRWLAGRVTADRWFAATVLPQLHVLAWGNKCGV